MQLIAKKNRKLCLEPVFISLDTLDCTIEQHSSTHSVSQVVFLTFTMLEYIKNIKIHFLGNDKEVLMTIAENLKTPKSKQTRAKILNTARDLFATKGFYKTTVKDITKAADLGYGTFYLYFKDKKNIFHALLERVEDELYTVAQGGIDFSQE